jgi:hypothetical protein
MKSSVETIATAQSVLDTFDLLVPLLEKAADKCEDLSDEVDEALDSIGDCRTLLKKIK